MITTTPVILCGGSGTRLWPLSRAGFPKQFLCLSGTESLFQQAVRRANGLGSAQIKIAAPYIISNEEHRFLALEQMRETGIPLGAALLEPVGRNTAPALTLGALAALEAGEDSVLVVVPADQIVTNEAAFTQALQQAVLKANEGAIVILGITPTHPETGYGYIKAKSGHEISQIVERFVEKPDLKTAQRYLAEGHYFWNSGIFVLRASTWIKALQHFRPDIDTATRKAWAKRSTDGVFIRPDNEVFAMIPSESVDYAVMERCPGSEFPLVMIPLDAGWSDLGAWDAVWTTLPKDSAGNAYYGDVLAMDSSNTLVHATSRLVALVGVTDLVVIETPDAVLVTDKSRGQDVKNIVNKLNQDHRGEHSSHRKVHRPWGWYDSVDEGQGFKVKRIQVNPLSSLSLQKHHHRAEHWVIVKGTAEITCGGKIIILGENQSTYIPLGEIHRLSNPGTTPLEIIEVQSGDYLGEDDIVRYEDQYGRSGNE